MRAICAVRSMLLLVLVAWPVGAGAQGFEIEPLVLDGDDLPDVASTYAAGFSQSVVVGSAGEVVFEAGWGFSRRGIFLESTTGGRSIARSLQMAADSGGGSFTDPFFLPLTPSNSSGTVGFGAFVSGGSVAQGVFTDANGTDSGVAFIGEVAPDTGGGSYSGPLAPHGIDSSGTLFFLVGVAGGTTTAGIFSKESGGASDSVALVGETAPGTGGTYASFGPQADAGDAGVAFRATVTGGSAASGVFRDPGSGAGTAIALEGGTAPVSGGTFSTFPELSMDASGQVAFNAIVSGGTASEGIFLGSGGTPTALVLAGEDAPGGGSFLGFANLSLADDGKVAFIAGVSGGAAPVGVFVASADEVTAVLWFGEVAPGTGGGTFSTPFGVGRNAAGLVAVRASVIGGTATEGIFLASSTPRVPALSPGSLGLLAALLGGLGVAVARTRVASPPKGIPEGKLTLRASSVLE